MTREYYWVVTYSRTEGRMDCPMTVAVCELCESRLYPVYCQVSYGQHRAPCEGCYGDASRGQRVAVSHPALREEVRS